MADELRLYQIGPSPNCMKARIALNYKELPFTVVDVNPQDRKDVLDVSGQPLVPVLTHGKNVVFDSASILRYLDANFRDTPQLYSTDRETIQEIVEWEGWARRELAAPVGITFRQAFAEKTEPKLLMEASRMMNQLTQRLEEQLSLGDWLEGDALTAADVTAAPMVFYSMVPKEAAEASPIAKFFAENLSLGQGRDATRDWVNRVMAFADK